MSVPNISIPGYEIQRRLGKGGMATVYLALQRSLDRQVAIKIMRQGSDVDETEKRRFLNEGRTMARLPHPNIVGVHDISEYEGISYIAMEFLDGGALSDHMKEGLTLSEAITVVVQIADALQFAHDHGIVHRDLKPANILFRGKRTPVLTDFGIARMQGNDATRLTQTGMMIGTPTYMSPEQAQAGAVDGRSDQYSLGVMFYEMLTRKVLFEGETPMQVAYAHVYTPPPRLPERVEFAQPVLDRMLAKDPKDRYPDLKTFARELKSVLTDSDALQQRLSVDPSQSVSERLRALGFSEAQIHTGPSNVAAVVKQVAGAADMAPGQLAHQLLEHSNLKLEPLHDPWRKTGASTGQTEKVSQQAPMPDWLRKILYGFLLLVVAAIVWEFVR